MKLIPVYLEFGCIIGGDVIHFQISLERQKYFNGIFINNVRVFSRIAKVTYDAPAIVDVLNAQRKVIF